MKFENRKWERGGGERELEHSSNYNGEWKNQHTKLKKEILTANGQLHEPSTKCKYERIQKMLKP